MGMREPRPLIEAHHMNDLHPFRYPRAFRSQLARLDRLYPCLMGSMGSNQGAPANLEIEQTGASVSRLLEWNRRLHHLEALIADWRTDGGNILRATADTSEDAATAPINDIPRQVTYVEFEPSSLLSLSTQRRSRIDGCYIREIIIGGKFSAELTFTCAEPGWSTMDSCLFADAMAVGARFSIGHVPFDESLELERAVSYFEGDGAILSDPALRAALRTVTTYIASLYPRVVPAQYKRLTTT
jgi:hypothetical protein